MQPFVPSTIQCFSEFAALIRHVGFSTGGINAEGIFSFAGLLSQDCRWHTGNRETDPWEWRIRVLEECDDIAYAKVFFGKSGYISKEWYPYFLAVRRHGRDFEEDYFDGTISRYARIIYDLITEYNMLPLHEIKARGGFAREEKPRFDRALTELQMKLYITMCGQGHKFSRQGLEYGWAVTSFCRTDLFWEKEVFEKADSLSMEEAFAALRHQILCLNPQAEEKQIKKFIG